MRRSLVLSGLLALGACAFSMNVPEGFLVRGETHDVLRATTPEGMYILVRDFDDPDDGTLAFWLDALRHDLVENRGYRFVGEHAVQDAAGREGKALQFATVHDGEPVGYLAALIVVPGSLFGSRQLRVVELTGPQDAFAAKLPAVLASIATLER
jgi:hypothetical protein